MFSFSSLAITETCDFAQPGDVRELTPVPAALGRYTPLPDSPLERCDVLGRADLLTVNRCRATVIAMQASAEIGTVRMSRDSLADKAADIIRDGVLDGTYRPGQQLSEPSLAAALGVSRGPVREALRRLANEGTVELHPYKGAFVPEVDIGDLLALYEAREALEITAARLAAKRADAEDVRRLEQLLADARSQVESAASKGYPQRLDFHKEIVVVARSPHILRLHGNVVTRLNIARMRSARNVTRTASALAEHRSILVAIAMGDSDAAEKAMRSHCESGVRAVLELGESGSAARSGSVGCVEAER